MASEPQQGRKRRSLSEIFGSQRTPRRPGLAGVQTPRATLDTPRATLSSTPRTASAMSRAAAASSTPRSTFLAPARDSSPSDSETTTTTSSSQTSAVTSPIQPSLASSALKRRHSVDDDDAYIIPVKGSRDASVTKRRRTIATPPARPPGVQPLPPQRRRKSAIDLHSTVIISDSECPVVIPPELAAIMAEGSSRRLTDQTRAEVSYISDSDQERPPAQ
ncbi:hypothetical protein OH76DRAFT_1487263 [Lentinus brumalis]|uniref:Uncharacterized protein n=1 Tax=Lentinus brumalis TaxID=2498619 RepID=A0A371CV62_9APHY|nr:hypothetical protein OH76DRAFT_1487263 [Polyporus brumalis]